jgi:hypothetical protein
MKIRAMRFCFQIRSLPFLLTLLCAWPSLHAQVKTVWRAASSSELEAALPVRAPVEKERIETEMRTASGIINSHGKIIAGVVLITAGYSADGKYSHFLLIQSPMMIGDVTLSPGSYVLGWNRVDAGLLVHIYEAATGVERVSAVAHQMGVGARVEAFRIWPPSDRSILQIGRFELAYNLRDPEMADGR